MKCPNCNHIEEQDIFECTNCGKSYPHQGVEELHTLDYFKAWMKENKAASWIGRPAVNTLIELIEDRQENLLKELIPEPARPAEEVAAELYLYQMAQNEVWDWRDQKLLTFDYSARLDRFLLKKISDLEIELDDREHNLPQPDEIEYINSVLKVLEDWAGELKIPFEMVEQSLMDRRQDILFPKIVRPVEEVATELYFYEMARDEAPDWYSDDLFDINSSINLGAFLTQKVEALKEELGDREHNVSQPEEIDYINFALDSIEGWGDEVGLIVDKTEKYLQDRRQDILFPKPEPTPEPELAKTEIELIEELVEVEDQAPVAVVPVKAPPAPKPKRDPIEWKSVWKKIADAYESGVFQKVVLYLSAFLIVASSGILVGIYWNRFPEWLQLFFIFSVPVIFYTAGYYVNSRMKLQQTGATLFGIGALMLGIDFIAIFQYAEIPIEAKTYWLAAAVISTTVYAITAWYLPVEFFAYVTGVGWIGAVGALLSMFNVHPGWWVSAAGASGAAMVWVFSWIGNKGEKYQGLQIGIQRMSHVLLPTSLVVLFMIPKDTGLESMFGFMMAVIGYGGWTYINPKPRFAYGMIASSVGMWLYMLQSLSLGGEWYAASLVLVSPTYTIFGGYLSENLTKTKDIKPKIRKIFDNTSLWVLIAAVMAGVFYFSEEGFWVNVTAFVAIAGLLTWYAARLNRPWLVFISAMYFVFPYSLMVYRGLDDLQMPQPLSWLTVSWGGLSLVYLSIAYGIRRSTQYAKWLYVAAHLIGLAPLYNVLGYLLGVSIYPALSGLGSIILLHAASLYIYDSKKHEAFEFILAWFEESFRPIVFVWSLGIMAPTWIYLFAVELLGVNYQVWAGPILAGLSIGYIWLGNNFKGKRKVYNRPLDIMSYPLALVGVIVAGGETWALVTALYLAVGTLYSLGYLYKRQLEMSLGLLLFLWPFGLTLKGLSVPLHGYSLGYALLASLGYFPLGLWISKSKKELAGLSLNISYLVAAVSLAWSFIARFGAFDENIVWVGMVVPLVITAQMVFSMFYIKKSIFAWVAAFTFPVAFGQGLTLFEIDSNFLAIAWVGLAFTYIGLERITNRNSERTAKFQWLEVWGGPIRTSLMIFGIISLGFTLVPTIGAYLFGESINPIAIAAQGLLVVLMVGGAVIYKRTWPLYFEPWIAVLPFSLILINYGKDIFGQVLEFEHYGIGWSVLGIVHLIGSALVDKNKTRYSHGLYLGGYLLTVLGVIWTVFFDYELIWTLGLFALVMAASAVLTHYQLHRTWDDVLNVLPGGKKSKTAKKFDSTFLWITAFVFPIWFMKIIGGTELGEYRLLGLGTIGLLYLAMNEWLKRIDGSYTKPFTWAGQFYTALGVVWTMPLTLSVFADNDYLLESLTAINAYIWVQALAIVFYIIAAWRSKKSIYSHVASWLSFFPITLIFMAYGEDIIGEILTSYQYSLVWAGASLVMVALGAVLDRNETRYANGPFYFGYLLGIFAVFWTVESNEILVWTLGAFLVGMVGSAVLVHIKMHKTWEQVLNGFFRKDRSVAKDQLRRAFLWVIAWAFPIWLTIMLDFTFPDPKYNQIKWLGIGVIGVLYLGIKEWLGKLDQGYRLPFLSAAHLYTIIGLVLSILPMSISFLNAGYVAENDIKTNTNIVMQLLGIMFYIGLAWRDKKSWPAHVASWLSFFPITLAFGVYGESIFGGALNADQYGLVWAGTSLVLISLGTLLDRSETRYANGPFYFGYLLSVAAVFWTIYSKEDLVWTLTAFLVGMIGSAVLVHVKKHQTWEEILGVFFGENPSAVKGNFRKAFLWLAAWVFPVWLTVTLNLTIDNEVRWLGIGMTGVLYFGVNHWLGKIDQSYKLPFLSAAHTYTLVGLGLSVLTTAAVFNSTAYGVDYKFETTTYIAVQALAVAFYSLTAWQDKRAWLTHVASWLSFFPITLTGIIYGEVLFTRILAPVEMSLLWIGWAIVLIGIGYMLDSKENKYADGPYLFGYLLSFVGLFWSVSNRYINIIGFGVVILLWVSSHFLVHFKRHYAYERFIDWIFKQENTTQQVFKIGFLFLPVYAFPIWLAQLLAHQDVEFAGRGLAFSILAPVYIYLGLILRPLNKTYTWPLFSAGYALTALASMLAFNDLQTTIIVLSLNAVVYYASAYIFKQAFWLYISNTLVPIIILLTINNFGEKLDQSSLSILFIGLSLIYLLIAMGMEKRWAPSRSPISTFSMPFYAPGYILSAIGLAVAAGSGDVDLNIWVFLLGAALYGGSSWIFKEPIFIYPTALLLLVPYYLGMSKTALDPSWYGVGWLPLIISYIMAGKFWLQKKSYDIQDVPSFLGSLDRSSMPFYLLAYGLSISMIAQSGSNALILTVALVAATVVYLGSGLLFGRPVWFYPGLFTLHLAILSYFSIAPSGNPAHYLSLPFLGATWFMALIGYALSRRYPVEYQKSDGGRIFRIFGREIDFRDWPFMGYLLSGSWSRPFFIFSAIDIVLWQGVAFFGDDTTAAVAFGIALLLALLATLWQDIALVYITFGFLITASIAIAKTLSYNLIESLGLITGLGLALYALSWIIDEYTTLSKKETSRLTLWIHPLERLSILLSSVTIGLSLFFVGSNITEVAIVLGVGGVLFITIAYRKRRIRLGYTAMAMLQLSWVLLLINEDISEPQWYAIPAGIYFTGMGFLERKRGKKNYALAIESFGLAVLILSSFIQSLDFETGWKYFIILLVEGLLVIWWASVQRLKVPFLIGVGATILNVVVQLVLTMVQYNEYRWVIWVIALGVGVGGLLLSVQGEKRSQQIRQRTEQLIDTLESWE